MVCEANATSVRHSCPTTPSSAGVATDAGLTTYTLHHAREFQPRFPMPIAYGALSKAAPHLKPVRSGGRRTVLRITRMDGAPSCSPRGFPVRAV